ncbi:MAG TPA: Crp/Fnr family transcriptional regulator [Gemmatimonadaceae bacterium]
MFRDTRLGAGGGIKKNGGRMATRVTSRLATRRPGNRILAALSERQYRRVAADVEQISLVAGQVIYEPGHAISHAYFPEDSVISHVCCPAIGSALEVAMIGREGLAGHAPLLGVPTTVTRVLVQIPGRACRVSGSMLRQLVAESEPFRLAVTRFSQALFDQVALCAACNVGHTPLERCARWMLMIHDRVEGRQFPVTQEFLAYMLGTSRQTVSVVARQLQAKRLIEYSRGRVALVNRRGLERLACPCYRSIADRLALVLGVRRGAPLARGLT